MKKYISWMLAAGCMLLLLFGCREERTAAQDGNLIVTNYAAQEISNITVSHDALLSLTAKGQEIAERVYERHQVLTDCLLRLGVNPANAKADACRLEHDLSDDSFAKIKAYYLQCLANQPKAN